MTFDFMLHFDSHIANSFKKAARQLNVMKKIGKRMNKLDRLAMYYSFIMSNLNYGPLTWNFTGETNTKKIEKAAGKNITFYL